MKKAVFWTTHGHRPQRDALLSVKGSFGEDVLTVGSRFDERFELVPADVVMSEPRDDDEFVAWTIEHSTRLAGENACPVLILAMRRRERLVEVRDRLAQAGVHLLCGATSSEALAVCEDKVAFASFVSERLPENHLPTTLVVDPASLEEAIASIEATGAEVCVKPPVGVYGHGFWHLRREARPSSLFVGDPAFEAERIMPTDVFRSIYAVDPVPLAAMPFMAGEEISLDCLFVAGRLVSGASRRKDAARQIVGDDPRSILPRIDELGLALGLDGIVNVQVMRAAPDDEGCRIMEINTRYAGGTSYLVAAGIDLFSEAVAHVCGLPYRRAGFSRLVEVANRATPVDTDDAVSRVAA